MILCRSNTKSPHKRSWLSYIPWCNILQEALKTLYKKKHLRRSCQILYDIKLLSPPRHDQIPVQKRPQISEKSITPYLVEPAKSCTIFTLFHRHLPKSIKFPPLPLKNQSRHHPKQFRMMNHKSPTQTNHPKIKNQSINQTARKKKTVNQSPCLAQPTPAEPVGR